MLHAAARGALTILFGSGVLLSGGTGCISTETTSGIAESLDSLGVSLRAIRETNVRFAHRDGLAIEQAADSIIRLARTSALRLEAYRWKMYHIPVIRQVYAQGDPIASRIDALACALQSDAYLRTGLGSNRFGEHQQIALNATSGILSRLERTLHEGITPADYDTLVRFAAGWSRDHPIDNHVFERPSIIGDMQRYFSRQEYSLGSAVGRIADDVDDLSGRLSVLAAQLPREARWQGAYLVEDLGLATRLESLDSTVSGLTSSLRRIERALLNGDIVVDLESLRSLHTDLEAALATARVEREHILAEIDRQRLATLDTLDVRLGRSISRTAEEIEGILSTLLWKTALVLAGGLGVVTILVLYATGQARRRAS
jgi:hypothetical protein